ncbi:MAG: hypothetical protein WA064_04285 [Candidatus Moraniibacteriota bacterium]
MDNKKIPTHLGTIVIVIIAITAGAFVWQYEKNALVDFSQLVVSTPATKSPVQQSVTNQVSAAQPNNSIAVPENWKAYTDSKFGFELRTPFVLKSYPDLDDPTYANHLDGQIANGEDFGISIYPYGQVTDGQARSSAPIIDLSKDASLRYSPYVAEPQIMLGGITWRVFYSQHAQKGDCDGAAFQALTLDGKNVIYVDYIDRGHCPGNSKEAPSVVFLKQVLSTFKFTNQNYIEVKELGFKIPVDVTMAGELLYKIVKPEGIDYPLVEFSSKTGECDAGTISKIGGTPAKNSTGETGFYEGRMADIKQFDGFFLFYQHPQAVSCDAKYADTENKMTRVVSDSLKNASLIK